MQEDEKWEVLSSDIVLQHPFLGVRMEAVRLPSGRVIDGWPIVDTRSYVMVVVENQAGELLILEGYKHGLGRSSWQVVGGYLEEGEEPKVAARREMLEESGYESEEWQALGSFVVDANRRAGTAHIFLARHSRPASKVQSDDLERVALRWVTVAEASRALYDGRIAILSTAVALALALPLLHGD